MYSYNSIDQYVALLFIIASSYHLGIPTLIIDESI